MTLSDPELLAKDGKVAFASALWFYLSPQYPKPSMHDVVVEYWKPNKHDKKIKIIKGFGVTTNIINGGIECGKNSKS